MIYASVRLLFPIGIAILAVGGPVVRATQAPGRATLADAARKAQPGEVILVHAGLHLGPLSVSQSGTEERPIVFRGAGDGEAIIRSPVESYNVVDASGRDYLWFERLTITGGRNGIK